MVPAVNINKGGDIDVSHCLIELGRIQVTDCKSISVKSSLIGYLPDGSFPNGPDVSSITVINTINTVIGGSIAEGNAISGYVNISNYLYLGATTYLISNNNIGTDISGTTSSTKIWTQKERIRIDADFYTGQPTYATGQILNNVIGNFYSEGIYVQGDGKVDIKGNYLNTDKTGTVNFELFAPSYYLQAGANYVPTAIYILSRNKAVIGGSNPGDANVITNVANAIFEQSASEVVITQNSIYCARNPNYPETNIHDFFGINDITKIPSVKITSIKSTSVAGTATPNARVELFYDNKEGDCNGCSPRNFLTAVTADAQGNWAYTGAVPPSLIASAILNNQTSFFTTPAVDVTGLVIKQPHCGSPGEISGVKFYNAAQAKWVDENNNVISTDLDIKNLQPGKYKLKIGTPTCGAESNWISIVDDQPKIDVSKMVATPPACNVAGNIKGVTATVGTNEPLKYSWKNESLLEVGVTLNVSNLPSGKYTLTVTGSTNGCTQTYGPIALTNTTGPQIDQSAAITTPTNCGQAKGSITNIIVTNGTGTLKYAWMDAAGKTVATTKDLINQPGGVYTLQVTDDTQCGPVYSTAIAITEVNGVTLDDSQKIITQPSCKYNSGSITNLKITGATIFKWYNVLNPNAVIATTTNLTNTPAGNYYVVASNAGGCSVTSPTYAITLERGPDFGGTTKKLTNATCNLNNGRIEVIFEKLPLPAGAVVSYRWVNHATSQTERITTTPVLTDIDAGAYDIYTTNSAGCETYLITYSIGRSAGITINSTNAKVVNDACATGSGSIKGITASGSAALTYLWADASGKPVGNNADLINVKAGSYTLTVTATDLNCSQTYGPVNIIDGSAVKIDQSAAVITPTSCGVRKGSITNITVSGTGTLKYTWKNPLGGIVGTNKDLTNQSGGVYTLQVTDDSQCGPVYSTAITIPEINGIVIDDSKKVISNPNCQLDNGSITGIKVPGATFYKWYSVNNQVVSTDVDLTSVPIGSYYLVAANGNGCSATSSTYVITRDNGADFGLLTKILKNATCGANNGSIEIGFTNPSAPRPTGYRWVNHVTGATIKRTTSPILTDLDAGVYDVYVTISTMVCEQLLSSCIIERNPGLDVVTTNAKVTDDACEGNTGSITGIGITGTSPLSYYWTDDKGKIVSNALDLKNVKAGAYLLNVKDGSGCQEGVAFNINSSTLALTAPVVKEIQLCSAGDAVINLPGLTPGYGYRLYNSLTDNQPADISTTGKFKIKAAKSRSYYVSLYAGKCESARAEVKISVGISLQNLVNTFSPNGDGINDTWKIQGIENYPAAVIQIFNRSGDKVFNSIGYEAAFDGNYKGKPLPTGTYYYIVNLNSGCSLLSGSLTIIR